MVSTLKEHIQRIIEDDLLFTVIVLICVAVASFGLGRMSVVTTEVAERPHLVPEYVPVESAIVSIENTNQTLPSATLVASVNGTRYHALSCPGAKQISEQNKIYFQTEDEARAAGYTPASNCLF